MVLNSFARPTRVRNRVLLLLMLVTGITYLDRVCIAAAAPHMMAQMGLSGIEMGYVFGVFAVAYGLFEVPAGWLTDRLGPRKMLIRIVVCWSVFTAFTGVTRGFLSLLVTRFVFGAAEAGAFPAVARALSNWFPLQDRGRVIGLMWAGARVGGSVAPPLAAALTTWIGWRLAFVVFGMVGLVWSLAFTASYRDKPAEHPDVNSGELAYIGQSAPVARTVLLSVKTSTAWRSIFSNSSVWALFWMYFGSSYGFWFFITWMPTFLMREHALPARQAGLYSSLPLAAGAVCSITGGMLSDWATRRTGSLRWGRSLVGMGGFLLASISFGMAALARGPRMTVLFLTLAAGGIDLCVPVAWAACLDIGGSFGGTVSAFMNAGSSISALISPLAAVYLFQKFGSFGPMFASASVIYLIAGLLWLKIDATRAVSS